MARQDFLENSGLSRLGNIIAYWMVVLPQAYLVACVAFGCRYDSPDYLGVSLVVFSGYVFVAVVFWFGRSRLPSLPKVLRNHQEGSIEKARQSLGRLAMGMMIAGIAATPFAGYLTKDFHESRRCFQEIKDIPKPMQKVRQLEESSTLDGESTE